MAAKKSTRSTPKKKSQVRPGWHENFLISLMEFGVVSHACRFAQVDRQTVYNRRNSDEEFASAWDEAIEIATEDLERECHQRARDGSDVLLMFRLKALKPEKYREPKNKVHASDLSDSPGVTVLTDREVGEIEDAARSARKAITARKLLSLVDKKSDG